MKKVVGFFYIFIFSLLFVFGQEDSAKIYETFTWDAVSSAKKYEVIIEKEDGENWLPYYSTIIKECSFEYALEPASYRICVVSINALGRKSKQNSWLKFRIIDDKVPYLYNNHYENNVRWNSPVLYINNTNLAVPENEIFIHPEEGMAENTLYLKGKNIFYEGTEFNLIPIEKSLFNGKDYPEITEGRRTVPLTIIQRNNKKDFVVVSYNPQKLSSGYYKVEAKNPGGYTSAISILVLVNEKLRISPVEMTIDPDYKVPVAKINKTENNLEINLNGKGITKETDFYLEPVSSDLTYPYESKTERQLVPLTVESRSSQNESSAKLSLKPEDEKLIKSGFYNVVAKSPDGQKESFPILIEPDFDGEHSSSVDKISSKLDKKNQTLELEINGSNLADDAKYTLISQYYDNIQGNVSLELEPEISKNNTKATQKISLHDLPIGKYVLMVESSDDLYPVYLEIDNQYNGKIIDVENKDSVQWLKTEDTKPEKTVPVVTKPENVETDEKTGNPESEEVIEDEETVYAEALSKELVIKPLNYLTNEIQPFFFPKLHVSAGINPIDMSGVTVEAGIDIFNINWFAFDFALRFDQGSFDDDYYSIGYKPYLEISGEITGNLIWDLNYFKPYIGLGFGCSAGSLINNEDFPVDVYSSLKLGFIGFDFLEFRYSLEFHDLFGRKIHAVPLFSMGAVFKVRKPHFENTIPLKSIVITKNGEVSAFDYGENIEGLQILSFSEGVEKISGFMKSDNLESVYLSSSIKEIYDNTFRTCKKLELVQIPYDSQLNRIGAAAFANDTLIKSITIPAGVTEIGDNAFANWTKGQKIVLNWPSTDTTQRNLKGLETTSATIEFADGVLYKNQNFNVLEDPEKWKMFGVTPDFDLFASGNTYTRGLKFKFPSSINYKEELNAPIDPENNLTALLENANAIEFKCKNLKTELPLNNRNYIIVIRTEKNELYSMPFVSYGTIGENIIDRKNYFSFGSFTKMNTGATIYYSGRDKIKSVYIYPDFSKNKTSENNEKVESQIVIYDIYIFKNK